MRRCMCAFGRRLLAYSLSLSLFVNHHNTLSTDTLFSSRLSSSTGVVPSLSPGAGVCWRGVRSPWWLSLCRQVGVAGIRVFPAACSICPLLSWFVPSSAGFLPHLLLAVVGLKVVALAVSTCSPVAVASLCFFFLFGLAIVRFGSVLILYHICLDMRRVVKDVGKYAAVWRHPYMSLWRALS
ncbi:hypothetical protein GQ42DRAFT_164216 [Ramicandelaber brevisporus]|nr:hypothetical protein GQ42DRAFT_164216 [Ramicandelaber brevisporus]